MKPSKLRTVRQLQGLSLYDLEREVGISASMLSLVERGLRRLNEKNQARVAGVLGCEPDFIFDLDEKDEF